MPEDLYDSDNPDAIPSGVHAAGYINGYAANAWATRGYPRFPDARRISVFNANDGDTLDVERGDAFPWEAPGWCEERRAAGVDPWVYLSYDLWAPTRTEFEQRGIREPKWWIALYDGIAELLPGAVAKQYADPARIPGNPHYDLSVVEDGVFGGSGGIITAQARRTTILANGSLHQFLRGTDNALWHRRCSKGTWSAWTRLGGTLTSDVISGGVDDQGALRVTVVGQPYTDGTTLYDISSADDGVTWSTFGPAHGAGTGLVTIGGYAGVAEAPEPSKITLDIQSVPGTATGTIS